MPKLLPDAKGYPLRAATERLLTREQFGALTRCAQGISLRFESEAIVGSLLACGYAELGVAGVITLTAEGDQHVQMHRPELRRVPQSGTSG